MTVGCLLGQSVSQYTLVYCDVVPTTQPSCVGLDAGAHWARKARSRRRRGAGASRLWGVGAGASGALKRARVGRAGGRGRQLGKRACRHTRRTGAGRSEREAAGAAGALGMARVVHLVHSACFWLGSTRYFSLVKFLDIIRKPGS